MSTLLSAGSTIPAAPVPEGKVVHTFADEATMKEFTDLWQQRQAMLVRMSLLQAYWNNEQAALGRFNSQMQSQYGLDTATKNYFLDGTRKVVVEREAPAETTASPDAAPVAPTQPPAESIAHTFNNEDEMKVFAELWQQRQVIGVRMAVLQNYWSEEQGRLSELNKQLAEAYNIDPAKTYFLDGQERRLIEREAPPAPQTQAAPQQPPAQPAAPTAKP
jgi:hypothetical protein